MPGFLRISHPDFPDKSGFRIRTNSDTARYIYCPPSSYRITQASVHSTASLHEPKPRRRPPLHGVPSHRRPPAGLPAFIVCHHVRRPAIGLPAFIKPTHAGVPRLDCPPSSSRVTQASHHRTARLHRIAAGRASRQWTARPRPLISRKRPCIGQPAFVVSIASVSNWHYRPKKNKSFFI